MRNVLHWARCYCSNLVRRRGSWQVFSGLFMKTISSKYDAGSQTCYKKKQVITGWFCLPFHSLHFQISKYRSNRKTNTQVRFIRADYCVAQTVSAIANAAVALLLPLLCCSSSEAPALRLTLLCCSSPSYGAANCCHRRCAGAAADTAAAATVSTACCCHFTAAATIFANTAAAAAAVVLVYMQRRICSLIWVLVIIGDKDCSLDYLHLINGLRFDRPKYQSADTKFKPKSLGPRAWGIMCLYLSVIIQQKCCRSTVYIVN